MRLLAAILVFASVIGSALWTVPPAEAAAADGCLPTNGLMNLNPADDLLAGQVRLYGGVTVNIGTGNVNWARTSLDHESAKLLYSLKWVEELVREYRRFGDDRYLDRAVEIVLDFVADNPSGGGPDPEDAWFAMHAGQRATTIACVAAVSDHPGLDAALRSHAQWLVGVVPGLPAWNQKIDPLLGLSMAGCSLNERAWRDQASSGFAELITAMIDADGVLLEQAPGYGRFVWEKWGSVAGQLEACSLPVPAAVTGRRAALLEWLAWMAAPDGTTTPIGDSFRSLEPPTPQGSPTAYTVPGGTTGSPPAGNIRVFDGGYVAGRSSWSGLAGTSYWTLRFGPARDLHGHEDHTSVTFWANGREVLIDSGHTGYGNKAVRDALLSPDGHNVLTLPDEKFRIRRPTDLLRSASGLGWRFDEVGNDSFGLQDGRFVDAPRTRGVFVLPDDGIMVVRDHATRVSAGPFEQLWHLVPGANVITTTRNGVVARHPAGDVDMHVMQVPLPGQQIPAGSSSVVSGQANPLLGWVAEFDGDLRPAPVVKMRRTGVETTMVTVIATTPVGAGLSARAESVAGGWTIDVARAGERRLVGLSADGGMRLGPPAAPALPNGRRCFGVSGSPGDAAIVNLTPVLAQTDGYGALASSDVSGATEWSNVNYSVGSIDPNVAVAPIGADGSVCFQNGPQSSVHVVADHLGTIPQSAYVLAEGSGASVRVADTRNGGRAVPPNGRRCFGVSGSPGDAAIVNLTPVLAQTDGYGALASSDVSGATEWSNVNYSVGSIDPNVAVAPIGADGSVCFQNGPQSSVHVVADHLGTIPQSAYVLAEGSGASVRVADTRNGGRAVPPNGRRCFGVSGSPGDAAIVNLTPVLAQTDGYGALASSDVSGATEWSNVNYSVGSIDPNVAVAPIGADGSVCFQNGPQSSVHVVADHLGTIPQSAYVLAEGSGASVRVADTRDP